MPDMTGTFRYRNTNIFVLRVDVIEQAKLDAAGVLGKEGKINAVTQPGCTERTRMTEPGFDRCHKARLLSAIDSRFATN